MRFPYQKLVVKDSHQKIHTAYRPLIPIGISIGSKRLFSHGLIDSGADVCLFGADFCQKLGLKLQKGEKHTLKGVGKGDVIFYLHLVRLSVGAIQVETKVGFSKEIGHIPFAILGQKGFFENFLVAFHYPKKWVDVVKA